MFSILMVAERFYSPYLCSYIDHDIPFLILEYEIGFSFKKSFTKILKHIRPKLEIIGCIIALLVFVVCCYYLVIVAWDLIYLIGSLFQVWGNNPVVLSQSVGGGPDTSGVERVILPAVASVTIIWLLYGSFHTDQLKKVLVKPLNF